MNKPLAFFKENKFHFIGWVLFMIYEVSALWFVAGIFSGVGAYFGGYVVDISLFYIHALIVLPFVSNQHENKFIALCFMLILECILYVFSDYAIKLIEVCSSGLSVQIIGVVTHEYYVKITWRFFYILGISWIYFLFRQFYAETNRNNKLERVRYQHIIEMKDLQKDLASANYGYLSAQINPRFLLNLLDVFYKETKDVSKKASKAILVLSEIMHYSLEDLEKKEFVLVSDEIRQVTHLIYLNQLRFDGKLLISFNYSKEVVHLKIIPLVLLTLVENMFKHGDLITLGNKGSIDLYVENNIFYILTENAVNVNKRVEGYNAGLDNINKRLAFAYNNSAELEYFVDMCGYFVARVKIPISSLMNPVRIGVDKGIKLQDGQDF